MSDLSSKAVNYTNLLEVDFSAAKTAQQFDAQVGTTVYGMELLVGDAAIANPIQWIAGILLLYGSHSHSFFF